jgi:glycosidase
MRTQNLITRHKEATVEKKTPEWVKDAIFYQVYPQSFYDTNSDGIGDIPGITEKLSYLKSLGFNAIWVNPCFKSPFLDAGYDVSDYFQVAERYGTNDDLRKLFNEGKKKGIRVCLDLVAAHTSLEHPWFRESSKASPNKYSNYYIWTGSAWESGLNHNRNSVSTVSGLAERNGNYASSFFYFQPSLNFGFAKPDPQKSWQLAVNHPDVAAVREEMKKIVRFWLEMGASGFRVDMASSLVKGDLNFEATAAVWREIRDMMEKDYPESILISEWADPEVAVKAGFDIDFFLHFGKYGNPYLSLFRKGNTSFFHPDGNGDITYFLDAFVRQYHKTRGMGYISIPTGNHDMRRLSCDVPAENLELVYVFLFTMPHIPFVYYGDEIGLKYQEGLPTKEGGYDRTGSRTPMQWESGKNMGFSKAREKNLYLPVDESKNAPNVADQGKKEGSLLNQVKKLLQLRNEHPCLDADGQFTPLFAEYRKYPFVYMRSSQNEKILVAINPSKQKVEVTLRLSKIKKTVQTLHEKDGKIEFIKGKTILSLGGQSYSIYVVE